MKNRTSRKFRWPSAVSLAMLLLASFALPVQAGSRSPEKTGAAAPVPIPMNQPAEATAPGALPAPTLASPPDGAHTTGNPGDTTPGRILYRPLGVPCFQWQSVTDADYYELQVSEVPQDTAIVLDIGSGLTKLRQTLYCPTAYDSYTGSHGIQDERTYYWRARAHGGDPAAWGEWSGWQSFTRHWANPPALLEPAEGAVLAQPPVLSWTPIDGAEFYELEISSDPDFPDVSTSDWPAFTWHLTTDNTACALATNNRTYKNHLPNDADIYWRVRPVSGGKVTDDYRVGPWSNAGEGQVFGLCWACDRTGEPSINFDYRPQPLTPVDGTNHVNSAYFSWTPVEGAAWYELEINKTSSFQQDSADILGLIQVDNPGLLWQIDKDWKYDNFLSWIYWRVRAINYYGVESEWNNEAPNNVSGAFRPEPAPLYRYPPVVPDLLFPHYYYEPLYQDDLWRDQTVSVPTFVWDQVPGATSYTLEVARNHLFTPLSWTVTTGNLSATPTDVETLGEAGVYYWRVRANTSADWSQRWQTRIDPSRQVLTPTAAPPRLLYPNYRQEGDGRTYGQEVLEYFPRLDWRPVSGADHYEVQIATDAAFGTPLETVETELTSYTPTTRHPPDTYYWRVRAEDNLGAPLGTGDGWSAVHHFTLMRHFSLEWLYDTTVAVDDWRDVDFSTAALLTTDPTGDSAVPYDQFELTTLYTARDNVFWYFGWDVFTITNDTPEVLYHLYLDVEGADGEGVGVSPSGGALPNGDEPYRPEVVLEWDPDSPSDAFVYEESGGGWSPDWLSLRGGYAHFTSTVPSTGTVAYTSTIGYAALAVPHSLIDSPATVNALLVTVRADNHSVIDTMDLGYVGVSSSPLPRPLPHDRYDDNGRPIYSHTPLMTWYTLNNVRNAVFESATTFGFSFGSQTEEGDVPSARTPMPYMPFAGSNPYYLPVEVYPDNPTHYWRLRSRYPDLMQVDDDEGWANSPTYDMETSWGRPASFTKESLVPTNLTLSGAVITDTVPFVSKAPLFSWDPVQGAAAYYFTLVGAQYDLTVEGTVSNRFIPFEALPNGDYTWRVHAMDGEGNYSTDRYAEGQFVKGSDTPEQVFPVGSNTFTDTVYFEWEPLEGAAYYHLEVASDPNWSINYDKYTKINNTMYVPLEVPDAVTLGNFYWQVCGYTGSAYTKHFMGCEAYYLQLYPVGVYLPLVLK